MSIPPSSTTVTSARIVALLLMFLLLITLVSETHAQRFPGCSGYKGCRAEVNFPGLGPVIITVEGGGATTASHDIDAQTSILTWLTTAFTGYHQELGDIQISMNQDLVSAGAVVSDSPIGDPFFPATMTNEFYFSIELPAWSLTLTNETPLILTAQIDQVPPSGTTFTFESPVTFCDGPDCVEIRNAEVDFEAVQGACCFPDGSCVLTIDLEQCLALGGSVFLGDGTNCDPNPCVAQDPTDYTCCELSEFDPVTGRPTHEGEWIRVTGVSLMESYLWAGNRTEFTLTDESGCCIDVYSYTPIGFDVVRGDMVEVIGTVNFYRGKTEISTPDLVVTILSQGNPLPAPWPIDTGELGTNGEPYESCLLKLTCVTITDGEWPLEGDDANLTVDDGSGPVTLRIDRDTEIDGSTPPGGEFSAIGIGGQYDSSEPYLSGYQMLPRDMNDILYDDCQPPMGACCFADGSCVVLYEDECTQVGGDYWIEDEDCEPNPCEPPPPDGACCYGCEECLVLTEAECSDLPDDYMWIVGENCEPNPCPPTAVEKSSWGRVKATYR